MHLATFSGFLAARSINTCLSDGEQDKTEEWKSDFRSTLATVKAGFGQVAFRRWVPQQGLWPNQVIAALFDAQMFAARGFTADALAGRQPEIQERLKHLFMHDDFRKSIDAATNTPSLFRMRITMMREMLEHVVT